MQEKVESYGTVLSEGENERGAHLRGRGVEGNLTPFARAGRLPSFWVLSGGQDMGRAKAAFLIQLMAPRGAVVLFMSP